MEQDHPDLQPAPRPASLPKQRLYRHCNKADLTFSSTSELEPRAEHLGQKRAVEALDFGLQMPHRGYNIFMLGSTGVGKRELLANMLDEESAPPLGNVQDWCYVHNFESPDKPVALCLPCGMGTSLRDDMAHTLEDLLGILPATFQSDEYQARVQELGEQYQTREKEAFQALGEKASVQQIAMFQTPAGYTLAPLKDGEIITPQDFEALPDDEKKAKMKVIEELKEQLKVIVRQWPAWTK